MKYSAMTLLSAALAGLIAAGPGTLAHAVAKPSPTARATNSPRVDPRIEALAKQWLHRFTVGDIDRSQLTAENSTTITPGRIQQGMALLKPFGPPIGFEYLGSEPFQAATGYDFLITYKHGQIVESIALDKWGKIAGINFQTYVPE